MNVRKRIILLVVLSVSFIVAATIALQGQHFALLEPRGVIGLKERNLMYFALALSLLVVVPVFTLTIAIVWRYRAGRGATYTPEVDHNLAAETVWWGVPMLLIAVLSVVTWQSTHQLDPRRALASSVAPLRVQVVALPWKWLFIYPDQKLATVNYLELPVDRPVSFEITSDAPMNSFWIPQLGGQIYAMPGMTSHLQLMAQTVGDYRGSSANISGAGFAGMNFPTHAVSTQDFASWIRLNQTPGPELNQSTYKQVAAPSANAPEQTFHSVAPGLYDKVVMQYMMPGTNLGATDVDATGRVTPQDYQASASASLHRD